MASPSSPAKTNSLGFGQNEYKGGPTTLCQGCGHNSITNHLIKALYDANVDPYNLAKMSGIGCSSKTPAYFVNLSHGFNAVHGRMPSVALGAQLANSQLKVIGVSGDGDTASIGMGQFCHMVRRNSSILYIVENNGVYGLTKGQFSATADEGAVLKGGQKNVLHMMDVCGIAIQLGGTFVARCFSGDRKHVVPLIQAGMAHNGTAVIDIISPCITFNNHPGATKSYDWVKDHLNPLQDLDYILPAEEITVDHDPGTTVDVPMPGGGTLRLKKLDASYDPTDRAGALAAIEKSTRDGMALTGLLFIDRGSKSLHEVEQITDAPLNRLGENVVRPSREVLSKIMDDLA